jgi:hypothetical protein
MSKLEEAIDLISEDIHEKIVIDNLKALRFEGANKEVLAIAEILRAAKAWNTMKNIIGRPDHRIHNAYAHKDISVAYETAVAYSRALHQYNDTTKEPKT